MNCLSHAFQFLDDGYFAAGTCIPDWLGMMDRSVRVRSKNTHLFLQQEGIGTIRTAIGRGILQHLKDDDWFHGSQAFVETSLQISRWVGDFSEDESGHRKGFVGHILIELLLDACIEQRQPGIMEEYYRVISMVSPQELEATVNRISRNPTNQMEWFMKRYLEERFLFDYLDDERLLYRLNRVLQRVRLEPFPDPFANIVSKARELVTAQQDLLLNPSE